MNVPVAIKLVFFVAVSVTGFAFRARRPAPSSYPQGPIDVKPNEDGI